MTGIITPKLQFLDLSHYSWPVDWDALKQNPDLIAVGWKCTQGQTSVDQYYSQARKEIQSRGYLFCTYHFGDHSDPIKQAQHFVDVANPDDNMRLALDWEDNRGNQMTRTDAEAFIQEVDRLTGRLITVYTGNTAKDQMGNTKSDLLGKHPLWIPRYSNMQPQPQASWSDWDVWQYAADGDGAGPAPNTAKGCSGHPDCNVFSKDVATVKATWSGKVKMLVPDSLFAPPIISRPKITITIENDPQSLIDIQVVRK